MQPLPSRPKLQTGPSRHVYDVIVLGGQLSGALAAALLAKRNYRVLLVEHDGLGTGYEHGDFILPYAPFLSPPLRTMPAVEDAFTELALTTTVQRALKPYVPALQLILPRHRVDLFADERHRLAELRREFGDRAPDVAAAYTALLQAHEGTDSFFRKPENFPPEGILDGWAFSKQVRKHPALEAPAPSPGDNEAARLLFKMAPFVTYLDAVPPLALRRTLSQVLNAPHRFPGGREGLREILCKRLTDLGGDYLGPEGTQSAVVESLSFEGSKLAGVKVMESDNVYRAPCIIASTDAGALRRLIPDKKKQRALSEALELVSTKRFLYSVNWVLPTELLPKGMGELLMVETEDDLGPLMLQVSPGRKAGASRPEDESVRVVCAAASVPAGARDLGEGHLQKLKERIGAHLERLMPFVRPKLILSSAPYLDAGGVRGSRLLPHPLYGVDAPIHLGVTGIPPVTPAKNLLLASREVFPGLGLEGELLSAVQAVARVQEMLKKHDPLRT